MAIIHRNHLSCFMIVLVILTLIQDHKVNRKQILFESFFTKVMAGNYEI